jgi:selenocysteine lyase/cysteine desulfurase
MYNNIQATGSPSAQRNEKSVSGYNETAEAFEKLESGVHAALETYSNVHRGSGYNSMVTTHVYEQARDIVLEYLGLHKGRYVVIFCTPRRAATLKAQLKPEKYHIISSQEIGLSLGVRALAVDKKSLPKGAPFQTGGGTTRLVSRGWVVWADAPDKFEAGTPAIINVIAFARALRLIGHFGNNSFHITTAEKAAVTEILYHDELENYSGKKLLDELRKTLIGRGVLVPTIEGIKPYINLDNAASTPTFMPIWNAVCQTWRQPGQVNQEIIHEVRSICARVLDAPLTTYDVIFTSNTTEAINLTAESLRIRSEQDIESVVLNTLLEHTSNDLPWRMISCISLIRLQVDDEGFVDFNELETLLREYNLKCKHGKKRIKLMAITGASNVLGVFNNLEEISRIVHRYGAFLLVDAAQLVAHRKVEMEKCGIDFLAFSAHKVYAPFGTGVLVARKGLLNFSSGDLELIRSSGEENAGGIASLGKALVLLQRIGLDLIREEEQALTVRALHGLSKIAGLTIYGIKDPDSLSFRQKGGVIVFSLKNIFADVVAKELSERRGIGVRYGCHCAHILIKHLVRVGPLLERFQMLIAILFPKVKFPGLARVSLGIGNSEEDVDILIQMVSKIARQPKIKGQKDIQQQMDDFVMAAAQKVYT